MARRKSEGTPRLAHRFCYNRTMAPLLSVPLLLGLLSSCVLAGDSKKDYDTCPDVTDTTAITIFGNEFVDFKHYLVRAWVCVCVCVCSFRGTCEASLPMVYLSHTIYTLILMYQVGLLHYPQSNIPDVLQKKTSGTYLPKAIDFVRAEDLPPYDHIPHVGTSELEPVLDDMKRRVRGEFYSLSDNGYGRSDNSADYALNLHHLQIRKSFSYRHGEHLAPIYTPVNNLKTVVLHDPHGYIHWKNEKTGEILDIQVEYQTPNDWTTGDNDFVFYRALTGRDFDPEGLAVISENCAMVADEFMPSIFMINPKTGECFVNMSV